MPTRLTYIVSDTSPLPDLTGVDLLHAQDPEGVSIESVNRFLKIQKYETIRSNILNDATALKAVIDSDWAVKTAADIKNELQTVLYPAVNRIVRATRHIGDLYLQLFADSGPS